MGSLEDAKMQGKIVGKAEYYQRLPPNYFAPKKGHQPLEVAVVGAGIAGLMAAIALSQSGHDVEVYERSEFANEVGAAINMCPNASRILDYYEFNFERGVATDFEEFTIRDGKSSEITRHTINPDYRELYGARWLMFHRVDLHNELKEMATKPRPPTSHVAKIFLLSDVKDVDLDGILTLGDGRKVQKDLIIVADGVHTKHAAKVEGAPVGVISSGVASYRYLIPTQRLLDDPVTHDLFASPRTGWTIAILNDKRIVSYPCRRGRLQNFGFMHPERTAVKSKEVWSIPATKDDLMEVASDFHPSFQETCRKAEEVKLWRLLEREAPLENLTRGKVVLIGDAAHPMLPHQAQGGGMAIEDGAALGVLLSDLTSKDEVASRLELFQELRKDRVSAMQIFSSVGRDQVQMIADKVRKYHKGPLPSSNAEFEDVCCAPNVIRDAMDLLARYKHRQSTEPHGEPCNPQR